MQQLHYVMGLTGLSLLVVLRFMWFGGAVSPLQTTSTESPPMPPVTAVAVAPVVPQDTAAPAAGQRIALQAGTDELATVQQQQGNALAVLQQQLERLFTVQHALAQQLDNLALHASSDTAAPLTTDDTRAAHAEHAATQVTQAHQAQAVDPAWSTQAATLIENGFARYGAAIPEAVLLDTECRTTVCRMEVAFESDATRNAVLMHLPQMIPWNSHGLLHVDPKASTVVFYVAREGERLDRAR